MIIGAVLVYRDDSLGMTPMKTQDKNAQEYPGLAAEALAKLDDGNRLVDRCRYYLEHFNKILVGPGKCGMRLAWGTQLIVFLETDINGAVPAFPSLHNTRGTLPPADFGLSPFGMELGEFMMDDDLVAMIDRQGILSMDPESAYNP